MIEIVKGTTPIIRFTFSSIDPTLITSAKLTIMRKNKVVLTKELSAAIRGSTTLSWRLSQEETLGISGNTEIMCNWLTSGGVRGASNHTEARFISNHVEEVMT